MNIRAAAVVGILIAASVSMVRAHDETREAAERRRREVDRLALAQADTGAAKLPADQLVSVTLKLVDDAIGTPLPCLVRITNADDGKAIQPAGEIHRAENWFSLAAETTLRLPRRKLKIEAVHGLETERAVQEVDLSERSAATIELRLRRFYDAKARQLSAGNTHLHLRGLSFAEMDRYLRLVPRTDGLEVVFVSHLERKPDDKDYISNVLTAADLTRLSASDLQFGNGEEHRHNFGPGAEGYGHVMFLNIQKLIQPVSIGPGIMKSGTDGRPLRTGIDEARQQGATVIWCHNRFGFEDVPNWLADVLDAQNINDGGPHGGYDETYYRYLNLGLKVPFSTGTDWFMYDFSRVYVSHDAKQAPSAAAWLKQLAAGRSTITNGPLLEFRIRYGERVNRFPGGSIDDPRKDKQTVTIYGSGVGRHDFRAIEVVYNGKVIRSEKSRPAEGHFVANMEFQVELDQSGWFALRIPEQDQPKNELGQSLFAHTSPIYFELGSRKVFDRATADKLLEEMRRALVEIPKHGTFADDAERERVLEVYREGIRTLQARIAAAGADRKP